MSGAERRVLALVATLAAGTLAAGVGATDLWPPNETRVAEISREMLADGSWSLPSLNGKPFLEEPPLFYWVQAGLYHVVGARSARAARWPAAGAAILGVLVTVGLARAAGARAGIAALVLATAPEYWWMARTGTPDVANATATAAGLLAFYAAWRTGAAMPLAVATGAVALAYWLKSFLGLGLAVVTVATFVALAGRGRLRPRPLACAALGLAAAVGGWLLLLVRHANGAGAVSFFVVVNHLGRLVGSSGLGHGRPVYYYVPNLLLDLLPWSLALPAAFVAAWRRRAEPATLFLLAWAGTMTIALTASASKSAHYILPAYPAFAVLIAAWWSRPSGGPLDRLTWVCLTVALVIVSPAATLIATSLDPPAVIATLTARGHGADAAAAIVAGLHLSRLAWLALPVILLGGVFVVAHRAGRPLTAAIAAGTSGIVVHVVFALVTLPAFNSVCSARSIGESLGRAARGGVNVVTFGFTNREAISPFMFYAGEVFPQVKRDRLAELLQGTRACALMPATAYSRLGPTLQTLPSTRGTVGELELVLVSDPSAGCGG